MKQTTRMVPVPVGVCLLPPGLIAGVPAPEPDSLREEALAAMQAASTVFRERAAVRGGYVYYYDPDFRERWGEGKATALQIWVQPPGTPRVGLAFLEAYDATGDAFYLHAATAAAEALVYGQLQSGGWTNCIDFDPRGSRVARYRKGSGRGRNTSTLDDGITQAALVFLMRTDRALQFGRGDIREAVSAGLEALLKAQFPCGGFPQVWDDPLPPKPDPPQANYPNYDWRTEGRIKNYWDMYTLNDRLAGTVAEVLLTAHAIYGEDRFRQSLARLGDFLLLARMPPPQPAWAQQYNDRMQPIGARAFEPPAIASAESMDAIQALLDIAAATGEPKYLAPLAESLDYLRKSELPDGRLARFYELRTNRPLYMERHRGTYRLTYDDTRLPGHYAWKVESRAAPLAENLRRAAEGSQQAPPTVTAAAVRAILDELGPRARWVSTYGGERLTGQPDFLPGTRFISSEVFSRNLEALADFVRATPPVAPGQPGATR